MKLSFELPINSTKEKIWDYYADVNKWHAWELGMEDATLEGEFVEGTKGILNLENTPPIHFTLSSIIPYAEFSDVSSKPMGNVTFAHYIYEEAGQLFVKHEVELDNDNEENLAQLLHVFRHVPASLYLLKNAVESE